MSQKEPTQAVRRPLGSVEQVSEYLGVPPGTLYVWRSRRTGPKASRVGRHLRYRWTDVERWLDQQQGDTGAGA